MDLLLLQVRPKFLIKEPPSYHVCSGNDQMQVERERNYPFFFSEVWG